MTLKTFAAAASGFLSILFYAIAFGHPSLIVREGASSIGFISFMRTWSFFTDLNLGLLFSVPLLVILASVAAVKAITQRQWRGAGMTGVLLLMLLASETTHNWNSGSSGIFRYGIWMIPVLSWLVAEYLPPTPRGRRAVFVSVGIQIGFLLVHDGTQVYLQHRPLAAWTLSHAPRLYVPEPEIFVERTTHAEDDRLPLVEKLPVGFVTEQGIVTKILTDRAGLERIPPGWHVDAEYLTALKRLSRDRKGMFYVHPPRGTVTLRTP